ncbi:MAG: dockerin type I domain-containing protein [Ruminococcus sp.]|nr:dockerin type I domain-containing protein [Ruminococcus sp.]
MKKTIPALCCAGILCTMTVASPWTVSADSSSIPTVVMKKSDALYFEVNSNSGSTSTKLLPDSQITGEISVIVHDHPIHVVISRQSSEAPVVYYETDLAPKSGTTATEYVFLMDYSELPQDASQFDKTYTADFLTGVYSSAYAITITVPDSSGDAVYTESDLLIADWHTEEAISGVTRYQYNVTFSEDTKEAVVSSEKAAVISDGSALLEREVQLLWAPYTLGDVDNNGKIDIIDAYNILVYYATLAATGSLPEDANFDAADVDLDGEITIFDAYTVLIYYAKTSAGYETTLEEIVESNS